MGVGDSGRRQREKWMHWEWQVACQYGNMPYFTFGFLQKLGNTQAAAVSGSLILGFLALLYFFFLAFCKHSTLNSQGSRPLLLLPPASADPASSKPPPWLLDDKSTILQAFFCLLLHLIMIQSSSSFIFVNLKIVF